MADDFKVDFSVIDDDIETLEMDEQYVSPTNTDTLEEASEEDKAKAAKEGKAESKAAKELKDKLLKEEEEARKKADAFILGEDPNKKKKPETSTDTLDPEEKEDETPNEEDQNLSGIAAFAKELYDIDFFTKEDENEKIPTTPEELMDKLDNEAENRADSKVDAFAGRFGEDYRDVFKAIFVDGADPKAYFDKYHEVQSWKDIDLTKEENQEKIVRVSLKNQGWEQEDIDEKIHSMKLNSELENDAVRFQKALVRVEESKLVQIQKDSQEKIRVKLQKEEQYKANVTNILNTALKTKELGGIPVTKELALQVRDFITVPKWKLPSGDLITNQDAAILELNLPQNHAAKVQLGLLLNGFEPGKPIKLNINTVQTTAQSAKNKGLFESLTKNSKAAKRDTNSPATIKSSFDDIDI